MSLDRSYFEVGPIDFLNLLVPNSICTPNFRFSGYAVTKINHHHHRSKFNSKDDAMSLTNRENTLGSVDFRKRCLLASDKHRSPSHPIEILFPHPADSILQCLVCLSLHRIPANGRSRRFRRSYSAAHRPQVASTYAIDSLQTSPPPYVFPRETE